MPAFEPADRDGVMVWFVEPRDSVEIAYGFETLGKYVKSGGRRRIVIAGRGVEAFDPRAGRLSPFRNPLVRDPELLERVSFHSLTSFSEWVGCLAGASRVWASRLYDGEPDTIALAAMLGIDVVAPRYPQSEDLGRELSSVSLYDPSDQSGLLELLLTEDRAERVPVHSPPETGMWRGRVARDLAPFIETVAASSG